MRGTGFIPEAVGEPAGYGLCHEGHDIICHEGHTRIAVNQDVGQQKEAAGTDAIDEEVHGRTQGQTSIAYTHVTNPLD